MQPAKAQYITSKRSAGDVVGAAVETVGTVVDTCVGEKDFQQRDTTAITEQIALTGKLRHFPLVKDPDQAIFAVKDGLADHPATPHPCRRLTENRRFMADFFKRSMQQQVGQFPQRVADGHPSRPVAGCG